MKVAIWEVDLLKLEKRLEILLLVEVCLLTISFWVAVATWNYYFWSAWGVCFLTSAITALSVGKIKDIIFEASLPATQEVRSLAPQPQTTSFPEEALALTAR